MCKLISSETHKQLQNQAQFPTLKSNINHITNCLKERDPQ